MGRIDYETWKAGPGIGFGYIGRNPGDKGHVFVATGDSGHGMTHGTIAGMLITDLIFGRPNEWEKLYDPSRKSMKSVGEYAKENVNVAKQYVDYISPGGVRSETEIRPAQGAIVRHGLKKLAVYRDDAGILHRASAVCPHLGCIVQWNSLEGTWDCPCHGSRFNVHGKVLNGPAIGGLEMSKPE
jgi:nitrite reductase/ring-hydroxylating ferredoxin subunit